MKMIKFDLQMDEKRISTLEDMRAHANDELLVFFADGRLLKWLESRGLSEEIGRIVRIGMGEDKATTLSALYAALGVQQAVNADALSENAFKKAYSHELEVLSSTDFEADSVSVADKSTIFELYLKAAEFGNVNAMVRVGNICERDSNVREHSDNLRAWYMSQIADGWRYAVAGGTHYVFMGSGIEHEAVEASAWYRKAAERGSLDGLFCLGWCFLVGVGVERDAAEAVRFYRVAADGSHAEAQANLGWCCQAGAGVTSDMAEAVRWYTKAADQGCAMAQHNLGVCLELGNGVAKDLEVASYWRNKVAESGRVFEKYPPLTSVQEGPVYVAKRMEGWKGFFS